ncbi:MAG: c-type cytochrome [Nitrospinota bacterium]
MSRAPVWVLLCGMLAWAAGAAAADVERGRELFVERCVLCHGNKGKGWSLASRVARPPVPVPDLTDPVFMKGFTEDELFRVIKEGGTREGKSRFMPPVGGWLSDEEIRDLTAYVRTLASERAGPDAAGPK